MKHIKLILAILICVLFAPVSFGLLTLDGKFCYHGHCANVEPFYGGFIIGIQLDLFGAIILGFGALVIWLYCSYKYK